MKLENGEEVRIYTTVYKAARDAGNDKAEAARKAREAVQIHRATERPSAN